MSENDSKIGHYCSKCGLMWASEQCFSCGITQDDTWPCPICNGEESEGKETGVRWWYWHTYSKDQFVAWAVQERIKNGLPT